MKSLFNLILLALILTLLSNCKKKDLDDSVAPENIIVAPDQRLQYIGTYVFTTIQESWMMGKPTRYDTTVYEGSVQLYMEGDNLKDLSSFDDNTENNKNKVTIEFRNSTFITPEILSSGLLVDKSGYHYGHSGAFTSDGIHFTVGGFGGLGGGTNYSITGVKK